MVLDGICAKYYVHVVRMQSPIQFLPYRSVSPVFKDSESQLSDRFASFDWIFSQAVQYCKPGLFLGFDRFEHAWPHGPFLYENSRRLHFLNAL